MKLPDKIADLPESIHTEGRLRRFELAPIAVTAVTAIDLFFVSGLISTETVKVVDPFVMLILCPVAFWDWNRNAQVYCVAQLLRVPVALFAPEPWGDYTENLLWVIALAAMLSNTRPPDGGMRRRIMEKFGLAPAAA